MKSAVFLLHLLNQQKYPASQLFLLMTIGPAIALSPWAEKVKGAVADMFVIIGRVPFFYYLLHIPLIHISALVVNAICTGSAHGDWYDFAPFSNVPPESWWSLGLLYLVFAVDAVILYVACRGMQDTRQHILKKVAEVPVTKPEFSS